MKRPIDYFIKEGTEKGMILQFCRLTCIIRRWGELCSEPDEMLGAAAYYCEREFLVFGVKTPQTQQQTSAYIKHTISFPNFIDMWC